MEAGAPQRVMSLEELTQGFYQMASRQDADGQFTQGAAECVHGNADLLNQTIERVNAVEAAMKLTQGRF